MSLEHEILSLFVAKGWTLSTAESCTGGTIASRLIKVSGASTYFLGSIVAYSNDFKHCYLGVPLDLIEKHGAVSEEVVIAMAQGLMNTSKADFCIAISGIAGPMGGSLEKPIGTIWIAVMQRSLPPITTKLQLFGGRTTIIEAAGEAALQLLYKTALAVGSL